MDVLTGAYRAYRQRLHHLSLEGESSIAPAAEFAVDACGGHGHLAGRDGRLTYNRRTPRTTAAPTQCTEVPWPNYWSRFPPAN